MVPKLFIATKAFIVFQGKVLIIRESSKYKSGSNPGKFDVVGGRVEPGQRFDESLLREIDEETGLTVKLGRPFFVNEWRPVIKREQCQIVGTYFECFTTSDQVKLSQDHDEYLWINPKDYKNYPLIDNLIPTFEAYLEKNTSPRIEQLFKKTSSLTEWFKEIKHPNSEKFREEDNKKTERLDYLNKLIKLPFDKPTIFSAQDVVNKTDEFKKFFTEHQKELCSIRLVSKDPKLPKLRTRGQTVEESMRWFAEQKINPADYFTYFIPHTEKVFCSTIFIVSPQGIFGEIIGGGLYQLSLGYYDGGKPITFSYDFSHWQFSEKNKELEKYIKEIIKNIKITDAQIRQNLNQALQTTFSKYYMNGYFEALISKDFGLWFIDYNRLLNELYHDFIVTPKTNNFDDVIIQGQIGSSGLAVGKVRIINGDRVVDKFEKGEVLVCSMTSPDYLPLMKKAAAIVTDQGGVLSHAAIVCREMKIPCIVGTKNATQILKEGEIVEVDANNGVIKYFKQP